MTNPIERDINQLQKRVDQYISQFEQGYFSPLAMIARFTEEVGELAREVNHRYGEKPKKASEADSSIENELGDLLFVMLTFANSLNIDLADAFEQTMIKIETRDKDRWTKKETERENDE